MTGLRTIRILAIALCLGLFAAQAFAAVSVGDKPKLSFKSVDGPNVSLEGLKGKIVVVDFWATWCGPCMAEAGHMVQVNEKYGPQGLQMIGISLDQDQAALKQVVKEKKFNWPQYFDGKGWSNPISKEWGVTGIPKTFLIGPDGTVLWAGHPAQIDAPLEKAFKETPPQLVDAKVLADANAALDAAETALKAGDARAAVKHSAKVTAAAKADKTLDARAVAVRKEVEAAADQLLAAVDPLIEKGEFVEAVARLKDLSTALTDVPVGVKAKQKLAEVLAKPEVKAKLAEAEKARIAAERAKTAADLLAAAKSLQSSKKHEEAYLKFKSVTKDYADTPSSAEAATAVATYEKDAAFMKRVNEAAAGQKARSLMSIAQAYRKSGNTEMARKKYQAIIDEFPGTSFADLAKKEMAALGK